MERFQGSLPRAPLLSRGANACTVAWILGVLAVSVASVLSLTSVSGGLATGGPSGGSLFSPASAAHSNATGNGSVDATGSSLNSSWVSLPAPNAPSPRSISQAAFDPALNETILFGGYYGGAGNVPLGDTWAFANNSWTELYPGTSPSPRWGATMVYDPLLSSLVLFGGRNVDTFFNDTWEFNATGWHAVNSPTAPSPRYDYGMAYDDAVGAVVLYGGGTGNDPAGTFTNFVFYTDTWAFQSGLWTNLTASAGPGPVGRLLRGQMTYDAADGYVVLAGGYSYVPMGAPENCGYVIFDPAWAPTFAFANGTWSELLPASASPPVGMGVLWYDSEANETLYYQGMWLGSGGACDVAGNRVWSFEAGNWTLVTEGNVSAPLGVEQPLFVNDLRDQEQVLFGGEVAETASEYYAQYLNDTWTYQPTWVTFTQVGVPEGASWRVESGPLASSSSGAPILLVNGPGAYTYHAYVTVSSEVLAERAGGFSLARHPVVIHLVFVGLPSRVGNPTPATLPLTSLEVMVVGMAAGGASVTALGAVWFRRQARIRAEGEELLRSMIRPPPPGAPPAE